MSFEPGLTRLVEDEEQFGRFNFQPEDRLIELGEFLSLPEPSRVVVLSGEEGIGRRYLLNATLHRLRTSGHAWELVDLDLEGYEPDHGTVEAFLEHALLRRSANRAERAQLSQALRPMLDIVGKTLPGAACIATLLGLGKPFRELLALLHTATQQRLPQLPERERVALLLDRLFELLADKANVAVLVSHPHRLPDTLKRLLLQLCDRRRSVVLALAALPNDQTQFLVPGPSRPPLRIELTPLRETQLPAIISRCFSRHSFPAELSHALWRLSKGTPREIAARVGALVDDGCLQPDDQGIWNLLDEGLEAAPLVRIFSYPFYDPIDQLLRSMGTSDKRERIERFLGAAVICGENVPADVVCAGLGFEDRERDEVYDFIDEHMVTVDEANDEAGRPSDIHEDGNRLAVFRNLQYNHPGLPDTVVYAFTNSFFRHAIRDRLAIGEWQDLAQRLLESFAQILPPTTRAAAEIRLSAVTFLEDTNARAEHLLDLAWWVGIEESAALTELLTQQLARHELDPEVLWLTIKMVKERWPSHRTWALLEAYSRCPDGVPIVHAGEYHEARWELLRALGRYREAVVHSLHAARFFQAQNDDLRFGLALVRFSSCLMTLGKLHFANRFARRALEIADAHLDPDHHDVGFALGNLGLVLDSLGDYEGAKEAHERALRIAEQAFGPDHFNVATAANNLGSALESLGDYEGAKTLHERALRIAETGFGTDHLHAASASNHLGSVLLALCDYEGARVAHERALHIWEKAFGPEHPDVGIAVGNLGLVLDSLRDYEGARVAHERALRIWEKAVGPDHPNVAKILGNLGMALGSLGDHSGAKAAHERALHIFENVFGPDHPHVGTAVGRLGEALAALGDEEGARAARERALRISEREP